MAGGIEWFRWHHGSVADPKFGLVAKRAGARLGDVIAVWAFVLESASECEDRGAVGQLDFEAIDFMLSMEDGMTARILDAMTSRGLLEGGSRVASWDKRQPKRERDDNSTSRVQAFRDRKRQETPGNASDSTGNTTEAPETPRGEESREEEKKKPPSVSSRASKRCPADFVVTEEMRAWAAGDSPGVDLDRETAKFKDWQYKAARSDWPAAWRSWIRKAYDDRPRAPQARGSPGEPAWRTEQKARMRQAVPGIAELNPTEFFEMEAVNAPLVLGR